MAGMDWSKLASRKLWVSVIAIVIVAGAELLGTPLSEPTMDAIQAIVMSLVGALGLVDTATAIRAGKDIAAAAKAGHAAVTSTTQALDQPAPPSTPESP